MMKMLVENTLFGIRDKVKIAIDRLRAFEPPEGYYLAFSGGKDSQTIYHLAKEAGVKFDAHYNLTTVDPPELVYFIRENYPDVMTDRPTKTMWELIVIYGPPCRNKRFCCKELKERGGIGRICLTGVRWGEGNDRKYGRGAFEVMTKKKEDKILFNDNDEGRQMFENCTVQGKRVINSIIDWTVSDVWEYIKSRDLKYCHLYDEGFHRLGCIGCPQGREKQMLKQFERWPKFRENYLRAFDKWLKRRKQQGHDMTKYGFYTAEDVMHWWIYGSDKNHAAVLEGQQSLF